jgi:hypothetical protein
MSAQSSLGALYCVKLVLPGHIRATPSACHARRNSRLSLCAHTIARERTLVLKGQLRIRSYNQQELRTHSKRQNDSLGFIRRGLLGFAGLAPHSGRSSIPFHRSCSGMKDLPFQLRGKIPPDKYVSIGKPVFYVKLQMKQAGRNPCGKPAIGPDRAWANFP